MKKAVRLTMGKKFGFAVFVLIVSMSLALSAYAADKATKLILTTVYNKDDMRGEVATYWAQLVEKKTNGRVKVELHYSGELVGGKEAFGATASGTADLCLLSSSYFTGEVPTVELFELPLPPPEVSMDDYWNAWKNNRDFFKAKVAKQGCVALMAFPTGTFDELISRTPIHTAADLKGKKIRVAGGKVLPASVQAFGAASASISAAEIYPALQNGTVDAAVTLDETYVSNSLYEVAPYVTKCRWYSAMYFLLMNPDSWNKLGPELQKIITDCSMEAEVWGGKHSYEAAVEAMKDAKAKAKEYFLLGKDEEAKWSQIAHPVWDNWAKRMGSDGPKLLDMLTKKPSKPAK